MGEGEDVDEGLYHTGIDHRTWNLHTYRREEKHEIQLGYRVVGGVDVTWSPSWLCVLDG